MVVFGIILMYLIQEKFIHPPRRGWGVDNFTLLSHFHTHQALPALFPDRFRKP